jgi:transposase
VEARYAEKRGQGWTGYKVHLTETCDEDTPHLLTPVTTTVATTAEVAALPEIQSELAARDLLPQQQLVEAGYVEATARVSRAVQYGIALCGPPLRATSWQARAADFQLDWTCLPATCPGGPRSVRWSEKQVRHQALIQVKFSRTDWGACPRRTPCTQTKEPRRSLTILPPVAWEALPHARQRRQTPAPQKQYAARAGIEGTISRTVRRRDLRQARDRGGAKTHLQSVLTATAINLVRLLNWLTGAPRARTRRSRLRQLLTPLPVTG